MTYLFLCITGSGVWAPFTNGVLTLASLPDGPHVVSVRSTDGAGNVQTPPYPNASFFVDTMSPVLALTSSTSGYWVNNPSVYLCANVSDEVPVTLSGTLLGSSGGADGTVSVEVGQDCVLGVMASQGAHTLTMDGVDAAGLYVHVCYSLAVCPSGLCC